MDPIIARVGMPVPVDKLFDFLIPEELRGSLSVGQRVSVFFAGRQATGIVAELVAESSFDGRLASIQRIVDGPAFTSESLEMCRSVAEASYAPLGLCMNRILPRAATRRSLGAYRWGGSLEDAERWLDSRSKRAPRQADVVRLLLRHGGVVDDAVLRNALGSSGAAAAKRLEAEQCVPVHRVDSPLASKDTADTSEAARRLPLDRGPAQVQVIIRPADRFAVYGKLIDGVLEQGGTALVLAPTVLQAEQLAAVWQQGKGPAPATSNALRSSDFPAVAVYHSDLGEGARGRVWEQARLGKLRILFGTRSALFVPLSECRLIVLEDEHDSGYKQEEQLPYYDARKVARSAACSRGARLVLASAAPSMETTWAIQEGTAEVMEAEPDDLQASPSTRTAVVPVGYGDDLLHPTVAEAVHQALSAGDRVMIVASRLGSFHCVVCRDCGRTIRCPSCGGNLAYDDRSVQLYCRICGHVARQPRCAACGATDLRFVGVGSAAVESAAREMFPGQRIARLDANTVRTAEERRKAHAILRGEGGGQARILVVSPMAATGPRLRGVRCAVVIGIDAILALPNFRASEQAFQLLAGVQGRIEAGVVYVQTRFPEHDVLEAFGTGDRDRFAQQELEHRKAMFYPPFSYLAQLRIPILTEDQRTSPTVARVEKALRRLPVVVLGPTPASGGARSRAVTLLLKAKDPKKRRAACDAVHALDPRIEINPDPVWF